MIIAVDGPAARGKGTIARALASHFELPQGGAYDLEGVGLGIARKCLLLPGLVLAN